MSYKISDRDIEKSLYEMYRAVTNPGSPDFDGLLEKVRYQLVQRGYDTDTWPEPDITASSSDKLLYEDITFSVWDRGDKGIEIAFFVIAGSDVTRGSKWFLDGAAEQLREAIDQALPHRVKEILRKRTELSDDWQTIDYANTRWSIEINGTITQVRRSKQPGDVIVIYDLDDKKDSGTAMSMAKARDAIESRIAATPSVPHV